MIGGLLSYRNKQRRGPGKDKPSYKGKLKTCSECVLKVYPPAWSRHWTHHHGIRDKSKMTEYKKYDMIPNAFFVSKPWKNNAYHQEEEFDLMESVQEVKVLMRVLASLMETERVKIPYVFKDYAHLVYYREKRKIFKLPTLRDCHGYGWWDLIFKACGIKNRERRLKEW